MNESIEINYSETYIMGFALCANDVEAMAAMRSLLCTYIRKYICPNYKSNFFFIYIL